MSNEIYTPSWAMSQITHWLKWASESELKAVYSALHDHLYAKDKEAIDRLRKSVFGAYKPDIIKPSKPDQPEKTYQWRSVNTMYGMIIIDGLTYANSKLAPYHGRLVKFTVIERNRIILVADHQGKNICEAEIVIKEQETQEGESDE